MPIPPPQRKTSDYGQIGLVSPDGTRLAAGGGPAAAGDAVPLLVDEQGRPWVRATVEPVDLQDVNLERIRGILANGSAAGNLGVNLYSNDIAILLDVAGRIASDVQRLNGIAPLVSAPGRLGVNIASADVAVLLDIAGRVAIDMQRIGSVAPLVSGAGRLGTNIASGDVAVLLDAAGRVANDLQRIAGVLPLVSGAGRLGTNIASGDVAVLLDASGRVANDVQRLNGIAPLVSAPGRLGVNIASADVAVLLDAAGRVAGDLQRIGSVAPLVSGAGRLGINAASNDVAFALDATGRNRIVAENANAVPVGTIVNTYSGAVLVTNFGVAGARRFLRNRGVSGLAGSFVMVFDAAALPANGTVPLAVYPVVGTVVDLDFTAQGGIPCAAGTWIASSSTPTALTLAAGANLGNTLTTVT